MKKKSRKPAKAKHTKKPVKAKKKVTKRKVKKVKQVAKPVVKKKKVIAETVESVVSGTTPTELAVLEQLFGGSTKMRLWKIFCLNPQKEFTLKQLYVLTRIKQDQVILSLKEMMRQGTIVGTRKNILVEDIKERVIVYQMNPEFPMMPAITETILAAVPRSPERVLNHIQTLPRLKMVLLSGFFTSPLGLSEAKTSSQQAPIDMLLVFEKVPNHVSETVAELERGLGRELRYATLDQDDFKYRHSIGDRLIRDVLDFEHIVAMDKLGFFR